MQKQTTLAQPRTGLFTSYGAVPWIPILICATCFILLVATGVAVAMYGLPKSIVTLPDWLWYAVVAIYLLISLVVFINDDDQRLFARVVWCLIAPVAFIVVVFLALVFPPSKENLDHVDAE